MSMQSLSTTWCRSKIKLSWKKESPKKIKEIYSVLILNITLASTQELWIKAHNMVQVAASFYALAILSICLSARLISSPCLVLSLQMMRRLLTRSSWAWPKLSRTRNSQSWHKRLMEITITGSRTLPSSSYLRMTSSVFIPGSVALINLLTSLALTSWIIDAKSWKILLTVWQVAAQANSETSVTTSMKFWNSWRNCKVMKCQLKTRWQPF